MGELMRGTGSAGWVGDRALRRAAVATAALAAALLAAPAAAPAAITCDFSSKVLTLTLDAGGDNLQLSVATGGTIVVKNAFTPVTCMGGTPTVTNTAVIPVIGGAFNTVVIHGADDFAPGDSVQDGTDSPAGATPEIEIVINLNDGVASSLLVDTGDGGGNIRLGSTGIDPNVAGEVQPDADITYNDTVRSVAAFGGSGADTLDASGGLG